MAGFHTGAMRKWLFGLMTVVALLTAPAVQADQKDARLGPLFDRLKQSDATEARMVEAAIWQIWTEAGDSATDALMQLGLQAMGSGNLTGALELFDAITVQRPDFAEGWNKRATVLYMLGAFEKSAEDVAKVLALEPRHFGALSGLGLINAQLNRTDEAIKAFEQALAVHPQMPNVKANVEALKKKRGDGAI